MAATLRGGLSLGLSGFAFWSRNIAGFAEKRTRALVLLTPHRILLCFFRRDPACNALARILLRQ
jgi:hypothetical protein